MMAPILTLSILCLIFGLGCCAAFILQRVYKLKREECTLIPELANGRVTVVQIGYVGTDRSSRKDKFRRYVVRYLEQNPIQPPYNITRESRLRYIEEAALQLRKSYRIQFSQGIRLWVNRKVFCEKINDELYPDLP